MKNSRQSKIVNRKSQEGIALVITLILLSVTLVMAVAFLAISRRERGSVTTETDTTTAKLAADAACAQAEAQIVSGFLASTNPYISSLMVSTNFISGAGFNPAYDGTVTLTNVNYNYAGGTPVIGADLIQNVANLYYLPRPPVIATNYVYGYNELQFYLDLNRNGRYDTNGWVTNLDNNLQGLGTTNWEVGDPEWIGILEHPDAPHSANNPFVARYAFIAVPANSLDLNSIHNQALDALTAYGAGNTPIDINVAGRDAYSRDQGVGTWEINLAAFLADLNTNRWDARIEPYSYPEGVDGSSFAFDDARALIGWRYGGYYSTLAGASGIFSDPLAFEDNGVDSFSVGLQTNFDMNYINPIGIGVNSYWLGADSTNNFFSSPSDLYNTNKSRFLFVNNLYGLGTSNDTYDRYTFYRMLGQLGTDSSVESDKINLNYSNAVVNYNRAIPGVPLPVSIGVISGAETNLVPWAPIDFFTAAADKMLHAYSAQWFQENPSNYIKSYYGYYEPYYTNLDGFNVTNISHGSQVNEIPDFGITNIPVFVNGQFVYSSAVNRVLQLAANIYDASTNAVYPQSGISNYPSVFRPVFWVTNEFNPNLNERFRNVYIRGYQCIQSPVNFITVNVPTTPVFTPPADANTLPQGINLTNVWGVPMIIGAKKGLPNFNAFEMVNNFFIERELQFNRNTADSSGRTYTTNQMYIMSVSNVLGVEDWNSYASNFTRQVQIVVQDNLSLLMTVTNNNGYAGVVSPFTGYREPLPMLGVTNMFTWSGFLNKQTISDPSFVLPLATNTLWLTNSQYYDAGPPVALGGYTFTPPCFVPAYLDPSNYLNVGTGPLPQFGLILTNHLQAYILDTHLGQNEPIILDYVQLNGMNSAVNVNQAIADPDGTFNNGPTSSGGLWSTNFYGNGGITPFGVYEQYLVSSGGGTVPAEDNDGGVWNGSGGNSGYTTPTAQQAFFQAFFSPSDTAYDSTDHTTVSNYDLSVQAPYTPTRRIVQRFVFEANDPLVHYLASDLFDLGDSTNGTRVLDNPPLRFLIGTPNDRYMPWGPKSLLGQTYGTLLADGNGYNLSYKDPLVFSSDNWDFPTNKYPTVGWLGRVHRGTPWQSVYLKSSNIWDLVANGTSGEATWGLWTGDFNPADAYNSAPFQDRMLFDLFTATPDQNATRGQLNVNVGADDPLNPLAGVASWSAALSAAMAFSNSAPDIKVQFVPRYQDPLPNELGPNYSTWTVEPAGINSANSPLGYIVAGINSARTNWNNIPNPDGLTNVYEHAGDVLKAPQLSDASPFLHFENNGTPDSGQLENGISDEMYEWLPQQMMSLLTVSGTPQSPPRYVIYCYGQTLKPAANGIVTSGQYFGLCTNYQVVAESASRAVIRIVNTPTPGNPTATPHIIVEQYNPLPPD